MKSCLLYYNLLFSCCYTLPKLTEKSTQQNSPASLSSAKFNNSSTELGVLDFTQSATTIRQIFENEELFRKFHLYADSRRAAENILFLHDYLRLKSEGRDPEESYHYLAEKYLYKKAELQVNLPSELVNKMESPKLCKEAFIVDVVNVVFNDLKKSEILRGFMKEQENILSSESLNFHLVNDYLRYENDEILQLLCKNPDYGVLIKFILMVQRFEGKGNGKEKKQFGSKIFVTFITPGATYQIPRKFIGEIYSNLFARKDYTALSDMRIEIIHDLIQSTDIIEKARVWKAQKGIASSSSSLSLRLTTI